MKKKTSITLSSDILARVDQVAGSKSSRSAFIENVLRNYFRERSKRRIHARDLERINAAADRLNSEAAEVLNHQAPEAGWEEIQVNIEFSQSRAGRHPS